MMYNTIEERSRFDHTLFRIIQAKLPVWPVAIRTLVKNVKNTKKIFFQMPIEIQNTLFRMSQSACLSIRLIYLLKRKKSFFHIENKNRQKSACFLYKKNRTCKLVARRTSAYIFPAMQYMLHCRGQNNSSSHHGTVARILSRALRPYIEKHDVYRAHRNPMLLFVFPDVLFRFNVSTPAFVPLFQLPPRRNASRPFAELSCFSCVRCRHTMYSQLMRSIWTCFCTQSAKQACYLK